MSSRLDNKMFQPWRTGSRSENTHSRTSSNASSCTIDFDNEVNSSPMSHDTDFRLIDLTLEDAEITSTNVHDQLRHSIAHERFPDSGDYQVGDCVKVKDVELEEYRVDFIQIKDISRETSRGKYYRGLPFTKAQSFDGALPQGPNEVCMLLVFRVQGCNQPDHFPMLVNFVDESIVGKRELIITNATFPTHVVSELTQPLSQRDLDSEQRKPSTPLVCRWKCARTFIENRRGVTVDERSLERIESDEVSRSRYRVPEHLLRIRWRGPSTRGGSWNPNASQHECAEVQTRRLPDQKYTLFDAFASAGGVSRGAQNAGIRVIRAVDKSSSVWDTYTANFPETQLYKMSIDQFVQTNSAVRPDILHVSPPCQFFSPAHTRPSNNDEENTDASLCCAALVHMLRPRLITVEQTFGVTFHRHQTYLFSMIGDLTRYGYSVRWKVAELCAWGLPQKRKRLIIIAAGPGEMLPSFPPVTHSFHGENNLLPCTTIRQALSRVCDSDELHDLERTQFFVHPRPLMDFDCLSGTILTASGTCYYPDGLRNYTLRELACLQGFPMDHKFIGNRCSVMRQIGNAFPPSIVKVLYRHLQQSLLQQDGMTMYEPMPDDVMLVE